MLGVFWNNFKKFRLAQSPLLGISGIRELNVLFIVRERLWRSLKSAILPQGVFHSQHQCGNFLLLESRILALESGVQLKEYEIPLTIAIWNLSSTDKESCNWDAIIQDCLAFSPGGGGYSQKNWVVVCAARFLKSLPYFRPKSVIFPTLFKTWSKIWYPISDLTLKSIHYLTPALQSVPEVKPVLKVMFIQSFELKGKWSYRLMMKNQLLLKNVPNSRLECINHTLFQAKMVKTDIQNGQKNHTLWRPIYLYSLYKGVPPGGHSLALGYLSNSDLYVPFLQPFSGQCVTKICSISCLLPR